MQNLPPPPIEPVWKCVIPPVQMGWDSMTSPFLRGAPLIIKGSHISIPVLGGGGISEYRGQILPNMLDPPPVVNDMSLN